MISAIYGYGMRDDTYRLALNPAAATTKRREPPPAVLDFYEPEEVEAIARAAEDGARRDVAKLAYDESEQAARALEDRQDAELYRVAANTGLRLGGLLALRWADVNLVDRRPRRPPRLQRPNRGPDEELAGPLHPDRRPCGRRVRSPGRAARLHAR